MMKPKQIVIGLMVIACGGLAWFALMRVYRTTSSADEQNAPARLVTVQLGKLKRMTLHHYITGYGTVVPAPATATAPAAAAPLAAPVTGIVARVNVVEGQHVKKGDVLVQLSSSAVTLDYAEQELARQRRLYAQHNTSLRNLQNAEAQLASLQVIAPLSGTVARVNVEPGAAVESRTVVAEVIDLNRLAVRANIPATQAGALRVGDHMQVLTQPPVTAALSFVSPAVDASDGTVLGRALLPPHSRLRPGQFVRLRIVTGVHADCLAAPEESVVTDVNGRSVIALINDGEAIQTPVHTGFRDNGWVEIEGKGLKAGDSVVTVGAYGLPNKTKIQVVRPSGEQTPATSSYSSPAQ